MHIPPEIKTRFDVLLVKKAISAKYHYHYRKWLRYYLDFCQKYHYPHSEPESLPHFIKKLQEKHQTPEQQRQASQAISLYYALTQSGARKQEKTPSANKASGRYDSIPSWKVAFDDLSALIKIKHYSPKTLSAYTNWIRKFQGFTRNKEIQSLSPSDVKEFLEYLAVKRKVSASTQNQAFNALLFFYRHIIKKDFGDQKDNLRAKRKQYIPVVLSREEVDSVLKHLSYPYDLVVKLLYGCGLREVLSIGV